MRSHVKKPFPELGTALNEQGLTKSAWARPENQDKNSINSFET